MKSKIVAATILIGSVFLISFAYSSLTQEPVDINSPYMKKVHQVSEDARPANTDNAYSYDFNDQKLAARESKKCKRCHGNMLQKIDNKPKYPIHDAMLNSKKLRKSKSKGSVIVLECVNCHKKVDLGKRSPDGPTFRVDRKKCTLCHEQTQEQHEQGVAGKDKIDEIGPTNLIAMHGIDEASGREWIIRHREVAGVIGAVQCRRCHAFDSELDFCNDCHKGWHGDNWKGRHVEAARELGVERCRQCHVPKSKMDFCSIRCHGANPLLAQI